MWPSLGIPVSAGSVEREWVHFQSWPQCSNYYSVLLPVSVVVLPAQCFSRPNLQQPTTAALNSSYPGRNPVPCHRLQPTVLPCSRAWRSTEQAAGRDWGYSRVCMAWLFLCLAALSCLELEHHGPSTYLLTSSMSLWRSSAHFKFSRVLVPFLYNTKYVYYVCIYFYYLGGS